MSSVGWIGLGKLGGPCAAALARYGDHTVHGYDVRGMNADDFDFSGLEPIDVVSTVDDVVVATDRVVYVAVQTPHSPAYGGETPVPSEPREFEYSYLVNAVRGVCDAARRRRKDVLLVVVSTVLPGTFDRLLRPIINDNEYVEAVYHPFFIAMGTVVDDFVRPEMTLFGADYVSVVDDVLALYAPIHDAPAPVMSIPSAELTKVAYNTFISMKIVYANVLAEMCDHTGADVDEVIDALTQATDRIISPRYLRAGMGDGGACHPRDNVALSALAQRYELSVDMMGFLAEARDAQTGRLADVVQHWTELTGLPVIVLGKTYKPHVALTDGSPALLLVHMLRERDVVVGNVDPELQELQAPNQPGVYVVGTAHHVFKSYDWPAGSIVIDPFGYLAIGDPAVTYVTPGRRR
jgi:UDPglucose 6-dehydrogenase